MGINHCFIAANPQKSESVRLAKHFASALHKSGVKVYAESWLSNNIPFCKTLNYTEICEQDVVISIGGDGTLLKLVNYVCRHAIPILGVNLGRLGFLMEINKEDMDMAISDLLSDNYYIEERILLETAINDSARYQFLNDVGILRGPYPGCINVSAFCDDELIFKVRGDGILVSTPTGTTGYAISAGGPVISPELDCILVQPVCSHVIFQRPVVLPSSKTVKLETEVTKGDTYHIVIDGQVVIPIERFTSVKVTRSPMSAKFIRFHSYDFLATLRKKKSEWSKE